MNQFTDDDLKQLKYDNWHKRDMEFSEIYRPEVIDALIARLETAERYAREMAAEYPDRFPQEYLAWSKAAGK